jgi:hypothetical protein
MILFFFFNIILFYDSQEHFLCDLSVHVTVLVILISTFIKTSLFLSSTYAVVFVIHYFY